MQLLRPEGLHFLLILRFACARYSLFTIYHSLFTENNGSTNAKEAASSGVRFAYWGNSAHRSRRKSPAAGFSIGSSNLTEAAFSGVYYAAGESFANRLRRETAVGPADPVSAPPRHLSQKRRSGKRPASETCRFLRKHLLFSRFYITI